MLHCYNCIHENIACRNRQFPAVGHGVTGVHREVEQRKLQGTEVSLERPDVQGDIDVELNVLPHALTEQFAHALDMLRQIDALRMQRLPTGERQQPAGQFRCAPGCLLGPSQRPFAQPHVARLGKDLQPIDDHHEQIVEVVRNPAGKLADRLQLLHLE